MLIDVNGMEFHLTVTPKVFGGSLEVHIVDESFQRRPLTAYAMTLAEVIALVESYVKQGLNRNVQAEIHQYVTRFLDAIDPVFNKVSDDNPLCIDKKHPRHLRVVSSFALNLKSTGSRPAVSLTGSTS